ncbi:alkaline phosphatase family protein [Microlunatus flavus]|uniref:Predicted pyrophosphatase or phosphodiesterase, AlkP superfamily n=1 Tax=Microlunatus flavus TaxID=1036181 RepID=A0A1H9IWL9_9ACTN|nr:Predicted pyrophosphatase or phosphodiesterase, AlkP superfamily [Microlunatus flavus]
MPAYGRSTLADLLPSVGHHLGVDGYEADVLGLPAANRYVVLLVDGLGRQLLEAAADRAPWLAGHLGTTHLTSGVPATTATSLTSLGTGLPPGRHGVVGITSRVPTTGEVLNALTWESDLVPEAYQPHPTVFERAAAAGVRVTSVGLQRFARTGLTQAALRGPDFVPFPQEKDTQLRIDLLADAASRGQRTLVYAYERELDHTGHAKGCGSAAWGEQLARVDAMIARLRDALPSDVVLLVTGDHGMVDVPTDQRLVIEDEPELAAGVSVVTGEARFRHLYVDRDDPAAVARRWRSRLGAGAWVRTRDEAVDEGWFGPVSDEVLPRYGDVVAAPSGDWAFMTRTFPQEMELVGMHASLTAAEMVVPLVVATGR